MSESVPDYTKDWKEYWTAKYGTKKRKRLQKAAEDPVSEYLPVSVQELNPRADKYQWEVASEDLKNYPDSVLADAKEGFAKFVDSSDNVDRRASHYDILSLNLVDDHFTLQEYFHAPRSKHIDPNTILRFNADISKPPEKHLKPAVIMYECPDGHRSRIIQPLSTTHYIESCTNNNCSNSVYQVSQETQFKTLTRFTVGYNGSELECVTSGKFTRDRQLKPFNKEGESIDLSGIFRNVVGEDGTPTRVLEVLSME